MLFLSNNKQSIFLALKIKWLVNLVINFFNFIQMFSYLKNWKKKKILMWMVQAIWSCQPMFPIKNISWIQNKIQSLKRYSFIRCIYFLFGIRRVPNYSFGRKNWLVTSYIRARLSTNGNLKAPTFTTIQVIIESGIQN